MNAMSGTMPAVTVSDGAETALRRLDIRVTHIQQLFDAMDAAPFREGDLDPKLVDFVVDWARDQPRAAPLLLVVHVSDDPRASGRELLQIAARNYFAHRAARARGELRQLFRTGRLSLLVGLAFIAVAIGAGDLLGSIIGRETSYGRLIVESMVIGSWVALWRPMEIFLYDWWPIVGLARLYDRLAGARVELVKDVTPPLAGIA